MASNASKNRAASMAQTNTINQLRQSTNRLEQKVHTLTSKNEALVVKNQELHQRLDQANRNTQASIRAARELNEEQVQKYRNAAIIAFVKRHDNLYPRAVSCVNRDHEGNIIKRISPLPWMTQREVLRNDMFCRYCDPKLGPVRKATTVDHIWPRALGGCHHMHNLIGACESCNVKKADRFCVEAGMKIHHLPLRFFDYPA